MLNSENWIDEFERLVSKYEKDKISIGVLFNCLVEFKEKVEKDCGLKIAGEYAEIISAFMHSLLITMEYCENKH